MDMKRSFHGVCLITFLLCLGLAGAIRTEEPASEAPSPSDQALLQKLRDQASLATSESPGLTREDDPALATLSAHVVKLLADGDASTFVQETIMSAEDLRGGRRRSKFYGINEVSGDEVERIRIKLAEAQKPKAEDFSQLAREIKLPQDAADYEVKKIEVRQYQRGGPPNTVMLARFVDLTLSLKSEALERLGSAYQGDLKIELGMAVRMEDRWVLTEGIKWKAVPQELLNEEQQQALLTGQTTG